MRTANRHHALALGIVVIAVAISTAAPTAQRSAPPPPLLKENVTVKISDHVWVIPDGNVPMVPNVGIVVGTDATLVIDTGMGRANADIVLREVAKVSRNAPRYLVTTHFHPEHTAGAQAFSGATYIIPNIQQQDLDELEPQFITQFSGMSPAHADLLRGTVIRKGDTLFDHEYDIDLGGVKVTLIAVGPTHTRGDTIAFVREDRVLFSGDVVMGKNFLSFSPQSNTAAWLKAFDTLDALKPLKIVPSHREMGDASFIAADRAVVTSLQARVRALKAQGQTADQIVATVTPEFQTQYPDWANPMRVGAAARTMAAE